MNRKAIAALNTMGRTVREYTEAFAGPLVFAYFLAPAVIALAWLAAHS